MGKALINVNVPKAGRIKSNDIIRYAVIGGVVIAIWNYSSRIPVVGPYADTAKGYVRWILGSGRQPGGPVLRSTTLVA